MRGQPYDVALDRVRRLVNERRFALGVQLIDLRDDPLEVAAGYARVAEGALRRAGRGRGARVRGGARRDSPAASWSSSGSAGSAADALTHASDLDLIYLHTARGGRAVGRREAARARTIISTGWRAG